MAALTALVAVAILAAAPPAHALKSGDCGTMAQVSADLIEAGQTLVAGMESEVFNADTGRFVFVALTLTANADRSEWFLISGDQPFGTPSRTFCVTAGGTALKIYDHRAATAPAAPAVARYGFDRAQAEAECAAANDSSTNAPECDVFDDVLDRMAELHAERPVLQGRIVSRKGGERGVMTITADPDGARDYRRLFSSATGATAIHGFGKSFFFAPEVIEALDGGR